MPRYYFHLVDNVTDAFNVDTHSVELPNADAARAEGVQVAGEMLRDSALGQDIRWADQTLLILE